MRSDQYGSHRSGSIWDVAAQRYSNLRTSGTGRRIGMQSVPVDLGAATDLAFGVEMDVGHLSRSFSDDRDRKNGFAEERYGATSGQLFHQIDNDGLSRVSSNGKGEHSARSTATARGLTGRREMVRLAPIKVDVLDSNVSSLNDIGYGNPGFHKRIATSRARFPTTRAQYDKKRIGRRRGSVHGQAELVRDSSNNDDAGVLSEASDGGMRAEIESQVHPSWKNERGFGWAYESEPSPGMPGSSLLECLHFAAAAYYDATIPKSDAGDAVTAPEDPREFLGQLRSVDRAFEPSALVALGIFIEEYVRHLVVPSPKKPKPFSDTSIQRALLEEHRMRSKDDFKNVPRKYPKKGSPSRTSHPGRSLRSKSSCIQPKQTNAQIYGSRGRHPYEAWFSGHKATKASMKNLTTLAEASWIPRDPHSKARALPQETNDHVRPS
ncbi:hypothetical protein IE53DRAFT_36354 [Violaceomyces palustris]|uniref:Uncharacterized protein n=1 Tax=Violaceomyces palustris TaxID=1673888 RepID=A0ACD0P192_9BASI|nr:hypothetical protein IE53DRAFT_36354 [Violaceomyces palustris]